MKLVAFLLCIFSFGFCTCCFADFGDDEVSYSDGKMFRQSRSAFLSYALVKEKTQYWGQRLEKIFLGEYAENVLVFAPLMTGKLELKAFDMRFYFDAREEESGVKYVYNF